MNARILLFTKNVDDVDFLSLTKHITRKPILRRHTDSIELDVGTESPMGFVKAIKSKVVMLRIRKIAVIPESTVLENDKIISRKMNILETVSGLFDEERYWEAHMLLETLWKCTHGNEKAYFRDIIHLSVSMIKFQMGQEDTARTVFARTVSRMRSSHNLTQKYFTFTSRFVYPLRIHLVEIKHLQNYNTSP